jgi:hypothetical protein
MGQVPNGDLSTTAYSTASNLMMTSLTAATTRVEPVARSVANANIEVAGLMTRRARALMDTSSRITQCKTPQEFADANMQYWQAAAKDYMDVSRRIATVFTSQQPGHTETQTKLPDAAVSNPFLENPLMQAWTAPWTAMWGKAVKATEAITPRDYITFPDAPAVQPPVYTGQGNVKRDPNRNAA